MSSQAPETEIQMGQRCPVCRKWSSVTVDAPGMMKWKRGALIQDAFPDMTKEDREILLTGTHPECWKTLWDET